VAIGAMRAAHELRLDVPGQLSIMGIDDIEMAAYTYPPLTTVHYPKHEAGTIAVDQLLARIDGNPCQSQQILVPTVVPRGSTGPPQPTDEA
jgi:LacI family transcriptional regulator